MHMKTIPDRRLTARQRRLSTAHGQKKTLREIETVCLLHTDKARRLTARHTGLSTADREKKTERLKLSTAHRQGQTKNERH